MKKFAILHDYHQRFFILVFCVGVSILLISFNNSSNAHPGYYGTAFHAHDIEHASDIANKEHKLIFVHVATNDRGWQHFRWPNSSNNQLIDLLVRETVIVEANLNEAEVVINALNITRPGIFILDKNKSLLAQLDENVLGPVLEKELSKLITSRDGIDRIYSAIKANVNPSFSQERLAAALSMAGDIDQAIIEYDKSLADAIDEINMTAKSRRQHIIGALQRLSEQNIQAQQVLKRNREYAAQRILQNPQLGVLAADIAQIDQYLKTPQDSIALFNALPKNSRARAGLYDSISLELQQSKRYEEILALVDPVSAIEGEIALYERNRILKPVSAEQGTQRGSRHFVVERGLNIVEALAGTRQDKICQALIALLRSFDASESTLNKLDSSLKRAGRQDLIGQ